MKNLTLRASLVLALPLALSSSVPLHARPRPHDGDGPHAEPRVEPGAEPGERAGSDAFDPLALAAAFDDEAAPGLWTSARPDGHAPIGVMGDHTHEVGEVMFSYRYMVMDMDGLIDGSDSISRADVFAEGFAVTPTEMTMEMHMFGLMYAWSDELTLMLGRGGNGGDAVANGVPTGGDATAEGGDGGGELAGVLEGDAGGGVPGEPGQGREPYP